MARMLDPWHYWTGDISHLFNGAIGPLCVVAGGLPPIMGEYTVTRIRADVTCRECQELIHS